MWRTAGNVKVDPVLLYELAREFVGPLKNAAADGAGAEKNQQFRSRHGLVSRFQSGRHRAGGRTGDDNAIRVSGRGDKLDAETGHIQGDTADGVQIQIATSAAF